MQKRTLAIQTALCAAMLNPLLAYLPASAQAVGSHPICKNSHDPATFASSHVITTSSPLYAYSTDLSEEFDVKELQQKILSTAKVAAESIEDSAEKSDALLQIASVYECFGDSETAKETLEESWTQVRTSTDSQEQNRLSIGIANVYGLLIGDTVKMNGLYEQVLEKVSGLYDCEMALITAMLSGYVHTEQYQRALDLHNEVATNARTTAATWALYVAISDLSHYSSEERATIEAVFADSAVLIGRSLSELANADYAWNNEVVQCIYLEDDIESLAYVSEAYDPEEDTEIIREEIELYRANNLWSSFGTYTYRHPHLHVGISITNSDPLPSVEKHLILPWCIWEMS